MGKTESCSHHDLFPRARSKSRKMVGNRPAEKKLKEKTTIYLDVEVKRRAVELGLNLSRTAENALKEAIRRLSRK